MSRDFVGEMDKLLDDWVPEGDWVPSVTAAALFEHLTATDPDLWRGWVRQAGPAILADRLGWRHRAQRSAALRGFKPGAFANAVRAHQAGDSRPLSVFETISYEIDEDHTQRRLGDCTGADLLFAAERYEHRAAANRFEAVFLQALAKRVGRRRVRDVVDETAVTALRAKLRPQPEAAAG
ncbi:MAG: hypothetical protein ACRDXE_03285 [Acidimicrobiales bacterium]